MTAEPGATRETVAGLRKGKGRRWVRWAAVAAAAVPVAAIVVVYLLPREAEVTRRVEIAAPAARVFPLVADLRHFPDWSPWFAADPDIAITYTGPLDGVGQTMTWQSKLPEVGSGRQTITLSKPNGAVEMVVEFADQGSATTWFRLEPRGETATSVVWGFRTDLGFDPLNRYSGLWIDGIVGPDFERGLARLKAVAESRPAGG